MITVAKAGSRRSEEIVLRVYKPDNASQSKVSIDFDPSVLPAIPAGQNLKVKGMTALEKDLPSPSNDNLDIVPGPKGFSFSPNFALTTLAVSGTDAGELAEQ